MIESSPTLDIARLDAMLALIVTAKERMVNAMAVYDNSHDPARIRFINGFFAAIANVVANFAAGHMSF